jgi:Tfp pilus assembly protein PilF
MDTMQRVQRAAALRDAQDMEAALEVIVDTVRRDPASPQAAFGHAQIAFEAWRPAADLFARAARLMPGHADLVRNHALALAAEGQAAAAESLIESVLADHPGWLDGHRTLAAMRVTTGDAGGWDRSYVRATAAEPGNAAIQLAWFHQHATRRDWDRARAILDSAKARFGLTRAIDLSDIFLACESGEADGDMAERFAPHADAGDPGTDICRVRHLLRLGHLREAEAVAARQLQGPAGRMFWPYAGLCWRLMDDPRAAWLDGEAGFVRTIDLGLAETELAELGGVLRGLHRLLAPYPEQSVRGGTQTDRNLLLHPDPAIQAVRARISAAVRGYVEDLPAAMAGHPLLGHRLDMVLFEGSWSVRLADAGFHSAHTHTRGWISSALYVALPGDPGDPPAGWFTYGGPPPELGLPLEPYGAVQPEPGRLVLFPSTMWHGTRPFAAGERLTIAFDVKLPPAIAV